MTGEEFMALWGNLELRQYIVDQAKRHSRNAELQEEFVQEAWMCISECERGCNTAEFYEVVALRAVQKLYQRERRYKKNEKRVIDAYSDRYE